jgi:hypothetical protein
VRAGHGSEREEEDRQKLFHGWCIRKPAGCRGASVVLDRRWSDATGAGAGAIE